MADTRQRQTFQEAIDNGEIYVPPESQNAASTKPVQTQTPAQQPAPTTPQYQTPQAASVQQSRTSDLAALGQRTPLDHADTSSIRGYLEQAKDAAIEEAAGQIDRSVTQGVNELRRVQENAEEQYRTQYDQIDRDERLTLDNRAAYDAARGVRGGIAGEQYSAIQNTAAQNRVTLNAARTKLGTDLAREMASLRANGEWEKSRSLLQATQQYMSQLAQLEQWAQEFNVSVDQFNAQMEQNYLNYLLQLRQMDIATDQWEREFAANRADAAWNQQFQREQFDANRADNAWQQAFQQAQSDFTRQQYADTLADKARQEALSYAQTMMNVGMMPDAETLKAAGLTKEYAQLYISSVEAAKKLASEHSTVTPRPVSVDAVTSAAPKVSPVVPVNPMEQNSFSAKAGRVTGNYLGKMASGMGAAFTNLAGSAADVLSGDKSYLERPSYQAAKAKGDTAYTAQVESANARISSGLKSAGQTLTQVSDRLAATSDKYQAAADADTVPVLRPVLRTVSDLVPFFALNMVPVAGQAAAGAYLVGESTGDARRAGLSAASQAALGFASVLSMGAAGQVGKALGSEKVVGWFLKNGKGPELVRVLEQAATSGLATGIARQVTGGVTKATLGVYAEQVQTARENLEKLSETDTASFTPEERAAYESAVAANQAVVNSHGMDFTAALTGIGVEVLFSIAGAAVSYGQYRAKYSGNFTTSGEKPLTPETSEYFKGVTTPEEAHARWKELSRRLWRPPTPPRKSSCPRYWERRPPPRRKRKPSRRL